MPRKRRGLDDQQKATLDGAFKAQFDEDVSELERLVEILPPNERATACTIKREQMARLVADRLVLKPRGVLQRLYGNGIPRSFAERERLMRAVEAVLRDQYEKLGASFVQDYMIFVNPVDGDDYDDDGSPVPIGEFEQWSQVRIGAFLADSADPAHIDTMHHYEEIFRQDMLDYDTGDFYSIRRLKGRNIGRRASQFLLYRESSERKYTFNDAQVKALDVQTKDRLSVEPELGLERLAHTHAFRIHFRKPIEPGESFDVVYNIRLPGELLDLNRDSEVMSISLTRVKNGVDKLTFNVALSFQPQAAVAYRLTQAKQFVLCDEKAPTVSLYKPKHWFEAPDQLGIEWSVDDPYIIRWSTTNPRGRMYIINFRGGDPENPLSNGKK
ncbi:MAG: hypothetical protein IVW52_07260 [Acidimicrobiales bacterium]|nr:hypothetical protein [Acidimicrobiales bacterium]